MKTIRNRSMGGSPTGRFANAAENHQMLGIVVVVVLVVFLVAALVTGIANLTTGQTIARHAFNNATVTSLPNVNITSTPGLPSTLQLYPLFFIFIGLLFIARQARKETTGI